MLCTCPAAASLPDVPTVKCPENFGQIQKVAFQRLLKDDGSKNSFATAKPITALASWTPLLTAADSTKIVVSPYIYGPTTTAGDPTTWGGGNDTPGGIEETVGRNPTTFESTLRKQPQMVIKALKELQCEAEAGNLGVYLFGENGNIGALQDSASASIYYPIPIRSLFVGDKVFAGKDEPDSNALNWSFIPNYSDNFVQVAPEFNPLSDLVITTASSD